ncbi:ribonuclease H-like domain-containing protein [Candidatus Woesearchaeota archaeon]|nr:ribonuclease H-like domain-containing protein [Candidatus Woesearchaeota archaeon]
MGAEKIQFYPLDITYRVEDNKAKILLFGRTVDGQQLCVIDSGFEPYFYVLLRDENNVEDFCEKVVKISLEENERISRVSKAEVVEKKFLGRKRKAVKVFVGIPPDVPVIRNVIKEWDMIESINEFDIHFTRRYLIDKGIVPLTLVEVEGEFINVKSKVPCFNAEKIEQASTDSIKEPKVLAFDIETYNPTGRAYEPDKYPIIMLAFYGKDYKKVITWKRFKTNEDYIEFVDGEIELINRFKEIIDKQKPDIITGYYSDGFDFPYIIARAKKYKIDLDLGLDYSLLKPKRGKTDSVQLTGIIHIDVFKFVKKSLGRSLDTDSYSLDNVSAEILGEKKIEVDIANLAKAWDEENEKLEAFCKYNLKDADLTYRLCLRLLPNIEEMVKIVGLPIYDVNRMAFSQLVEWYIIKQTKDFNEIVLNRPHYEEISERRQHRYKGAFVFEPKPGLYNDIVVFDFRSLYPTIITSHNIGPSTLNCGCCKVDGKFAPTDDKKYWFCSKRKGFLPVILEDLITRRMRIKEMMKDKKDVMLEARSQSLKLLANAFYGYLGFFGARWYCFECAESVTAYGRHYIHKVIDAAKEDDFEIIYGDSLPYDRPLFIRLGNGDIMLIKIGELYDKYKDNKNLSTVTLDKNNKVTFKPIVNIIRHEYRGKLLKIITKYGSTIVTPQHSVYSFDKDVCLTNAEKLKKGDHLISLTNTEIDVTYKEGYIFDLADMDFDRYKEELMLYSDNLKFPSRKGKCPYCKKEGLYLASHVFAKHNERRQRIDKKSLLEWVGGKFGKIRKIPRYWTVDKDLAWLLGFYCAEGSVSDVNTKTGRKCLLSFGSQDRKIIEKVKGILDVKTKSSTKIIKNFDPRNKKNMFYYRVQCMPIIALFQYGFKAGKGSELKRVPWFIFTAEESLRRAFLKGYLDGDGNLVKDKRYKTHFIRFSTKSKDLAEGLAFLLKTLKHGRNFHGKEIKHVAWKYRRDKPKIQSLRLQSAKRSKNNFCLAEIISIEEIPNQRYVYDIEVKGTHNFVDAEGMILVHNTDSIFLNLKDKKKEDALNFVDKINIDLPGIMELEYEGFYPSGIFVSAKEGEFGAKKKYALIDEKGNMKITGFETVRRNWSFIAKEVQEEVLNIILKEQAPEEAMAYAKGVIKDIKNKKIENKKVIIFTQIQKPLNEYTSVGPHVAVARRLAARGEDVKPGYMVKFIITEGSGIIRDRAKIPDDVEEGNYDSDYYINNQVIPSVERIFNVLGYTKDDLMESKDQSKLGKFF